jgi:hypothetical protein
MLQALKQNLYACRNQDLLEPSQLPTPKSDTLGVFNVKTNEVEAAAVEVVGIFPMAASIAT